MEIKLNELDSYFSEVNINAPVVKIILMKIEELVKMMEAAKPRRPGRRYEGWLCHYEYLKATQKEVQKLYDLLVEVIPVYEENCQRLYKNNAKWDLSKIDNNVRSIGRQWIESEIKEIENIIEKLRLKKEQLLKNLSKTEVVKCQRIIEVQEHLEIEMKYFLYFIDYNLKEKLNKCFNMISNSFIGENSNKYPIELDKKFLYKHLNGESSVPKRKAPKPKAKLTTPKEKTVMPVSKTAASKEKLRTPVTKPVMIEEKEIMPMVKPVALKEKAAVRNRNNLEIDLSNGQYPHVPIYVFYGRDTCFSDGHDIENIKARVDNLLGGPVVEMNVMYCLTCHKYRISSLSYENYINNKIIPKVPLEQVGDFKTVGNQGIGSVSDESLLKLYGYTVGQSGLHKNERQRILAFLLDRKIATKNQILNTLQFDVRFIGKKRGMEKAVYDWNTDIRYVNDYRIEEQRKVNGKLIKRR